MCFHVSLDAVRFLGDIRTQRAFVWELIAVIIGVQLQQGITIGSVVTQQTFLVIYFVVFSHMAVKLRSYIGLKIAFLTRMDNDTEMASVMLF